ncbi:MAG: chemotaxis protein CheB [Promethearchaeota archaeon]
MPIKVLIASNSTFRRSLIAKMLSSNDSINVVNVARNYNEVVILLKKFSPEILILDIEFENKDWFRPFNTLTKDFSIHTIILIDVNPKMLNSVDIPIILKSQDYIIKPIGVWKDELPKIKNRLISKVLTIHSSKFHKIDNKYRLREKKKFIQDGQKSLQRIVIQPKRKKNTINDPQLEEYFLEFSQLNYVKLNTKIIVIGASVGGPRTLKTILSEVPKGFPAPILIVQHLDHLFVRQFVSSLRSICKVNVKIGMNNEEINPETIYISPGDKHMLVTVKDNMPCIRTFEGKPVNFCRPSVDVLFYSTARIFKKNCLGILLTGMGSDGVNGLKAIKSEGGKTIAESEETSILYGMPKVAAERGVADLIVPNYKIIDEMIKFVN